jgi:peptide/nickel transport system permease protein
MSLDYLVKRLALFVCIILTGASLNFFLPRLAGQDPIRQRLMEQTLSGASLQAGVQDLVDTYNRKFGLDRPLLIQYADYIADTLRFDLGYSIANYPTRVGALIGDALPWTIGLLSVSTVLAFSVGSLLGALIGWDGSPRWLRALLPCFFVFSAVPFFLLGLMLLHFFAFQNEWLPLFGAYTSGTVPSWSLGFALDVLRHAILPAAAIVLAGIGQWALGMRGMMVTLRGEDFMVMARAKGLTGRRIFFRYALRNALMPQTTKLALALGHIVSGAVLVEIVFGYPGVGTLLLHSIQLFDYFVVQGIVLTIVVAIATAMLVIELLYPLLDPRTQTS